MTKIINDCRLTPIEPHRARKLPEGTVLIVERVWRDFKTWKVTRRAFYRVITQYRKTAAGLDVAIRSEPDATWPEIPTWASDWIWLEGMDGYMGYYTIEEGATGGQQ